MTRLAHHGRDDGGNDIAVVGRTVGFAERFLGVTALSQTVARWDSASVPCGSLTGNGDEPRGRPKGEKKKVQVALKLDPEFLAYLQAAAYWSRTSVTKIMEDGAALILQQLEARHNGGKKFKPKPEDVE